jgi:hypothetical protein
MLALGKSQVNGKVVYVVKEHQQVLRFWAELRRDSHTPPTLLTLDAHTDTLPAFLDYLSKQPGANQETFIRGLNEKYKTVDFNDSKSIDDAIIKLDCDEHIDLALETKIIWPAYIIAYETPSDRPDGAYFHQPGNDSDMAIEGSHLRDALRKLQELATADFTTSLDTGKYILDIDLDYFRTKRAILPDDPSTFHKLIRGAQAITVSTDPSWVMRTREDRDLTAEFLADQLQRILSTALA